MRVALVLFCFATLNDWLTNQTYPSHGSQSDAKTNRDLVARVFPRLMPVTCMRFEFSLVRCVVQVCHDWFAVVLVLRHSTETAL